MQPEIEARAPGHLIAGALDHQAFHLVDIVQQRLVHIVLELGLAPAARGGIGSDHQLGIAAIHPRAQRIGRKPGKDDGMDRADPRTGQHGIGGLGDHRQIDHHPVALGDTELFQNIGHPADMPMQLGIGDVLGGLVRIVGLEDDRSLIAAGLQMPVDTVGRDVERAILEPLDVDLAGLKRAVLDLGEGFDPVDALAMFAPEGVGIIHRGSIHRVIFGGVDMGARDHLGRRGIALAFGCVARHSGSSLSRFRKLRLAGSIRRSGQRSVSR